MSDFNLSDKIKYSLSNEVEFVLLDDVKEFIRLVKTLIIDEELTAFEMEERLNKFAGDKLNGQ